MASTSLAATLRQSEPKGLRLYQYQPLPTQPVHIRLVKISPSRYRHDNELRCELRTAVLESTLDFCAVSYEWGPIDDGHDVHICTRDGTFVMKVRRNLRDFLRRVRNDREFMGRWLWIDQICINQRSNNEKSHQVAHMQFIYTTASRTIVWIPPAPLETEVGVGRMKFSIKRPSLPIKIDRVHAVMESSYWRRVWIIQEVVLSQQICFMNPTFIIDESSITSAKEHYDFTLRFRSAKCILNSWRFFESRRGELTTWAKALLFSAESAASIPADRVYALLGLVQPKVRITPDYTASCPSIFIRVLMAEISHELYSPGEWWICDLHGLVTTYSTLKKALNIKDSDSVWILSSCMVFGFWLKVQEFSNREVLNQPGLASFVRACGEVVDLFQDMDSGHDAYKQKRAKWHHLQLSWYPFQWLCQKLGIGLDDAMLTKLKTFKDMGTRVDESCFKADNTPGSPLRDMLETLAYQTDGLAAAVSRLRQEQGLEMKDSSAATRLVVETEDSAG